MTPIGCKGVNLSFTTPLYITKASAKVKAKMHAKGHVVKLQQANIK
jgi:hypothetical protein